MGLAERFKNKLENRNIFEKNAIEQTLEENDIKFISKPAENKIEQKNTSIKSPVVIQPDYNILEETKVEEEISKDTIRTLEPEKEQKSEPVAVIENVIEYGEHSNKFEDLETELINKIRKTPYWEEFSTTSQTNMIENYFNVKIKSSKYSQIEFSDEDKHNFIQTVLTLSNNR